MQRDDIHCVALFFPFIRFAMHHYLNLKLTKYFLAAIRPPQGRGKKLGL